ncbi:MAG: 50S ribosome-binding GTPase [Parcubacteria group bacterium]|nr:50S ribosome-binding GTPase [Parcubacteria group bacterium]
MKGRLYILTGPSGVGKTTVAKELLGNRPSLKKVVTCTTREPREGEVDGVDYHFLDTQTIEDLIARDEMFEWDVHYGGYYGSRKLDVEELLTSGVDVLFVVDVAGAKTIKEHSPETKIIFLMAEDEETLLNRIDKRDQGKTSNLEERKRALEDELAFGQTVKHKILNKTGALDETIRAVGELMDNLDSNT